MLNVLHNLVYISDAPFSSRRLGMHFLFLFLAHFCTAQVTVTTSNLPMILIDTKGQKLNADTKIVADMNIIDNSGKDNNITDLPTYTGKIGVELRGSTSLQVSNRLPLSVETRKDDGVTDKNVALLGMAKESDWAFIAPYSDKTLIRDAFMYSLGRKTMKWAPDFRFADVFLNSNYEGIYMVTERIKRDSNRLNINKLLSTDTQGDALTGGYIFALDKIQNGDIFFNSKYVMPNNKNHFPEYVISTPDKKVINTQQRNYIRNYMQNIEEIFAKNQHQDPINGYQKWLDVPSFVDFVLLNEISRNVDGYRLSTYFHKDLDSRSKKLSAGPIWDFNIALGNADYCNANITTGWAIDFNQICFDDYWIIASWWEKLFKDPYFRSELKKRWQSLRKNQFSDAQLMLLVDDLQGKIGKAETHHFKRFNILNTKVWPNPYTYGNYNAEVNALRTYIKDRTKWIDGEIDKFKTLSVADNDTTVSIDIFPNPTDGFIYISSKNNEKHEYKLLNINGIAQNINIGNIDTHLDIADVQNLPSGIYFLQILQNNKVVAVKKIVK